MNYFHIKIFLYRAKFTQEIDPSSRVDSQYEFTETRGFMKIVPQILQSVPGIDEAFSFAELMRSVHSMKYSVIIFDTAPTGHTLRLIHFPKMIDTAMDYLIELESPISGIFKVTLYLI